MSGRNRWMSAALALALAIGVFAAFPAEAQEGKSRGRWEYRFVCLSSDGEARPGSLSWNSARAELDDDRRADGERPTAAALETALNRCGADGWELVEHGDRYALFKRPAP